MKKEEAKQKSIEISNYVIGNIRELLSYPEKIEGIIKITSAKIDKKKICTLNILVPDLEIEKYINTGIPFEHCDELNEQIFNDLLDNFLESETIGVGRYREIKYSYGENFSGMDYISLNGSKIRLNFINHGNKYDNIVSSYKNRIKDFENMINNRDNEQSKTK